MRLLLTTILMFLASPLIAEQTVWVSIGKSDINIHADTYINKNSVRFNKSKPSVKTAQFLVNYLIDKNSPLYKINSNKDKLAFSQIITHAFECEKGLMTMLRVEDYSENMAKGRLMKLENYEPEWHPVFINKLEFEYICDRLVDNR